MSSAYSVSNSSIPDVGRNASSPDVKTGFDVSIVQLMCFPLIIAVGLIGNTLICVALRRRSRLRVTDCFILNLAATDLATCLISIPFDFVEVLAGKWPFGSHLCKIVYPLQTILISVSVYTLLCMSLERRRTIIRPFMPRVKKWRIFWWICLVWIFSISLMGPYIAILGVKYSNGSRQCTENWPESIHAKAFTLSVFLIIFLLPLFAITANYVTISYKLWKDIQRIRKAIGKSPNPGKKQLITARAQRNMRIVKIFVLAVIVFAVCMVPNNIMWIWHDYGSGSKSRYFGTILVFCNILVYANSAINPFIFISLHSRYCKDIISIFPCRQCSTNLCFFSGTENARQQLKKYRRKKRFFHTPRKTYLRGMPWESDLLGIRDTNKQPLGVRHIAEGLNDDNDDAQAEWMALRPRKPRVNFGGEKIFHIDRFDNVELESPI